MAAGDINDPLSQIPGIALADDSGDPSDLGAGYALLKFKNGLPVWLPNGGTVRTALARGATSQLSTLTEEASPLDADLFLMERASDGALRKVQAQNLPGGGAGGGGAASLLSYDLALDTWDGAAFTGGTWYDACANQTFTPTSPSSVVIVAVRGQGQLIKGTANSALVSVRIVIDSSGTPAYYKLAGGAYDSVDYRALHLSGVVIITGLSAAAHTVKVQASTGNNSTVYLRASTAPDTEFLSVAVAELLPA